MSENIDVWHVLTQMVSAIGQLLGDESEVVLHDLRQSESSIVAIVHGEVSGRKVGDAITNLGLPMFRDPYDGQSVFNYPTRTRTGKVLKSSSIVLKDKTDRAFAAICINCDVSKLLAAAALLRKLAETTPIEVDEILEPDIDNVIDKVMRDALAATHKPVEDMNRVDKQRLVHIFEEKGVFSVKRSVDRVAAMLGISRATVYAYMAESRLAKDGRAV